MQRIKLWLIISIIMIVVGIILLAVVELVYIPRIGAYGDAASAWSQHISGSAAPTLEQFGLDGISMAVGSVMGIVGVLLLAVGVILFVIAIILKVIYSTRVEISIGLR